MSTRDIQAHLRELYGTDVLHDLIFSKARESVMELLPEWQCRPLDAIYPIIYLDALFISTRDGGQVIQRAFYIAFGVGLDGRRDVLGIWAGPSHPRSAWADRRVLAGALEPTYTAENEAATCRDREARAPAPREVPDGDLCVPRSLGAFRPVSFIPAGDAAYALHDGCRGAPELPAAQGASQPQSFPNEEAVVKLLFLTIQNAKTRWSADRELERVLRQLALFFEGRLPA